ncbi:MAG: flagellar motor switch protein FliY [Sulfurospirillaceae bacterium]|nr:flagellar motor switch protein FliY [Sulfurospirillaceae bacterium]MCK9545517.1 flagellar motor switch protein FliY [Sulfurospirillaceae bacterium]MDY0238846.1 flagellar motor switch protein FliY [Campylobacterales bacterium]NLM99214.1 flagellar motor switch protein FliY [Campylobacteraceae bacterium]
MSDFIKLLGQELITTVEGLTGVSPSLEIVDMAIPSKKTSVALPVILATIAVSGDVEGTMKVALAPSLATGIGSLMMGEEEAIVKKDIDEDDLDATKEIISNIFGSFSTALGAQKDFPKLSFKVANIEFLDDDLSVDFKDMKSAFVHSMTISSITDQIIFAIDENLNKEINKEEEPVKGGIRQVLSEELNSEEMRNIALIMDVQLPVRVRIGSKKMLLKDVLSMDIGSVIELNQLANDPLEILVGDKVIAMGEVVIVDGNFGVQITEIGTKRERLEQLR